MASKQFALNERTSITVYKRRTSRSLRLSVRPDGSVRVSIPAWTPYKAGVAFARSRLEWIESQRSSTVGTLTDRQPIGRAHRLRFEAVPLADKVSSRLRQNEVVVFHPADADSTDPDVQAAAAKAGIRALRRQAEALLPQRLASLADHHGISYGEVRIKQMKSRWGSCDQHGNIVLNLFLVQLPWECIDYVLLHELTHTRVMRHGPDFWSAMEKVLPDVKQRRKALRQYHPMLHNSAQPVA